MVSHTTIVLSHLNPTTVNQEIFVYENIRALNVHVNKFSWVPHEIILTWKIFKFIEITVHLLLIKYRLLYLLILCYRDS